MIRNFSQHHSTCISLLTYYCDDHYTKQIVAQNILDLTGDTGSFSSPKAFETLAMLALAFP